MPVYAVTYRYTDDTDRRLAIRPTHREYLRGLADHGLLLVSGPYAEAEVPGALLIFQAAGKEQVLAALEKDPFRTEDVIADIVVTEWEPVLGPLADRF